MWVEVTAMRIRDNRDRCIRQKEKILPLVGQLEQEVASAQMRVQQPETECPSNWSPMKNERDDLFGTIGSSVDRAWRGLSPGEVGG